MREATDNDLAELAARSAAIRKTINPIEKMKAAENMMAVLIRITNNMAMRLDELEEHKNE